LILKLEEQEVPTLPEHLSSLLIFGCLCSGLFIIVYPLAIVLSALRFMDSDYLFEVFKLFYQDLFKLFTHNVSSR